MSKDTSWKSLVTVIVGEKTFWQGRGSETRRPGGPRVSISKILPSDAGTTDWAARNQKVSRGSETDWREVRGF